VPDVGTPAPAPGHVTVLLFAGAREAAGEARCEVAAEGSTVSQLVDRLAASYGPAFEAVLPACAIWVNRAPALPSTVLSSGDEVAVLPPVSGG
jgi:molybdopterin converting factor small subunit